MQTTKRSKVKSKQTKGTKVKSNININKRQNESEKTGMDTKKSEDPEIVMNDDEDWWESVQTFDFGVQMEEKDDVDANEGRFAEVTDEAWTPILTGRNSHLTSLPLVRKMSSI